MTLKIMIVDDSVVVRGLLRQIIEQENDMDVVTTAANGETGVKQYGLYKPDVVLMDIEMPIMNGIDALSNILKQDPTAKVIMCSSLTQNGAKMTHRALEIGALECLAKPSTSSIDRGSGFKDDLLRLLRGSKQANIRPLNKLKNPCLQKIKNNDFKLLEISRNFLKSKPKVLAIGSSTGGPVALNEVITNLSKGLNVPVFITQHMPAGFTKILADSLAKKSGFSVTEGENNMIVKNGHIYIAPGGKHMEVEKGSAGTFIKLNNGPQVHFCKPSVDVMIDSIYRAYKTGIITTILTGMGGDGADSCARVVEGDDTNILIAQDELTSAVWGMPKAAVDTGKCHGVFPMSNIAPAINKLLLGQKP